MAVPDSSSALSSAILPSSGYPRTDREESDSPPLDGGGHKKQSVAGMDAEKENGKTGERLKLKDK